MNHQHPEARTTHRSRSPPVLGHPHKRAGSDCANGPGDDVATAQALREAYSAPSQSRFRVAAILRFHREDGTEGTIEAVNVEPHDANIRGAICAERAAMCKFQAQEERSATITRVVCVTDSPQPIFPGPMCREYLTSMCHPRTEVVVSGSKDPFDYFARPLSYLLPMPSVYCRKDVDEIKELSLALHAKVSAPADGEMARVYRAAMDVAKAAKGQQEVFHIVFGAAVLFADGHIGTACELKAIEYGASVDAVTLLLPEILRHRNDKGEVQATKLLQVDQFGVATAPTAAARTLLIEHGMQDVIFAAHDEDGHWLPAMKAADSLPSAFLDWGGGVEGSHL
mmetsp:Transcript_22733/g.50002  ORF Transcript_22733/g.50002 Transcript_22733/m.50002 type:complete len:339 (-) Transcript_22733:88-1104(-)|eukprot:CAMPEP_0206444550 /NCGR_PEP_ID=MMETSP0324_2-20121206/14979_1 /ASSEMBLY_ACC=CAM_ASM_000836 /TAXON_ID=2866 /ORGANISM="Crypthecodinium cohnii, Strain Seligo" /LENGTH=338 /DNA_ID=CAMNT_0053912595 /DNA_START=123 /DNA_END=1139 /DNA_ORIENTATION=-